MNKQQFQRLAGIEVSSEPSLGKKAYSKTKQLIRESLSKILEEKEEEEDLDSEPEEDIDLDMSEEEPSSDMGDPVETIQKALTDAQEAATTLNDEKLISQIGNTITYFTRNHISKPQPGGLAGGDLDLGQEF